MRRGTIVTALVALAITTGCEVTGEPVARDAAARGAVAAAPSSVPSGRRIAATSVVLTVYGMTTIQGANNVRAMLRRVPGVSGSRADIGAGAVTVDLVPGRQPTEAQLLDAVRESGFPLVRVEEAATRP